MTFPSYPSRPLALAILVQRLVGACAMFLGIGPGRPRARSRINGESLTTFFVGDRLGTMSKTIAEKLLIKPNTTVWLSDPAQLPVLAPMPDGVREADMLATASTAVLFAEDAASVRKQLAEHSADLAKPAVFWVAYPKGNKADINRDTLWPIVADFDMRPCGQVAIDDRWSGLRFRPNREGEGRFTGGAK
ncbi:hypothetical protein [Actinoplanes sp. NPDC048796]|uniref:hypothetical protein n=1 Tax=Actinoplanes sp. NPDC048796 TaxID=3155640 RepID=UPI003407AF44